MVKTLQEGATIENMVSLLKLEGVFLVNQYLQGELLEEV